MRDLLWADNVSFRYAAGAPLVVDGVTVRLAEGALAGILGPNGSGKTTLLRLLSGTRTPLAGRVRLGGRPLAQLSRREAARQIAVVPQDTELAFEYRAIEIVLMGRHPHLGVFTVEGPDGRRTLTARYLVGCDGGRSATRRSMDVTFEGITSPTRWLVIDVCNDPLGTPNAYLGAEPAELRTLQPRLAPDTRVVQYLLLDDEGWAFVMSRDDIQVVRLSAGRRELTRLVDGFRTYLDSAESRRQPRDSPRAAGQRSESVASTRVASVPNPAGDLAGMLLDPLAVPNELEFTVTDPGTYRGQCAEFCGDLHADMTFTVEAMEPAAFAEWLDTASSATPTPPEASLPPDVQVVELSAENIAYDRLEIEVPAGEPFVIRFTNLEDIVHNVSVYDGDATIFEGPEVTGPDATVDYLIPALDPGEYTYICDFHPIPDMTGTLIAN